MVNDNMREESKCDVETGFHSKTLWWDRNSSLVVCTNHMLQYEEREKEFGPFDWLLIKDEEDD